jgi:hypothetical protein
VKQGVGEKTHLDELVPASRDNDGVLRVGREADARDPIGVALVGDGVLAVTEGVPQLDGAVTRGRDDLTVVGREGDGQDVVGVADEAAGGLAGRELPQAESLVPGRGQGVGTVGRDDLCVGGWVSDLVRLFDGGGGGGGGGGVGEGGEEGRRRRRKKKNSYTVRDNVRVTVEAALGVAVRRVVASQVPDDQGLVARGRQEHVGAEQAAISILLFFACALLFGGVCSLLKRGSQTGDPAGVALEGAAKNELLGHVDWWWIAVLN